MLQGKSLDIFLKNIINLTFLSELRVYINVIWYCDMEIDYGLKNSRAFI